MLHLNIPNLPQILTYSVLAAIGLEVVIAILLVIHGDPLGVVLALGVGGILYWFVCRQLVALLSAAAAAAACAALLFLCALVDFVTALPYYGLVFLLAAIVTGFVFVLLLQGGVLAELKVGDVVLVGASKRSAHLRMLEELRDAGLLTEDEFTAKQAKLAS